MSAPVPPHAAQYAAARDASVAHLWTLARAARCAPPTAFPGLLEELVEATLAHVDEYGGDAAAFGPLLRLLADVRRAPAYLAAVPDATWARLAARLVGTPAAGPLGEAWAWSEACILPGRPMPVRARPAPAAAPPDLGARASARGPAPPRTQTPPAPWHPPTL